MQAYPMQQGSGRTAGPSVSGLTPGEGYTVPSLLGSHHLTPEEGWQLSAPLFGSAGLAAAGAGTAQTGPTLDPAALVKSLQAQMAGGNVLAGVDGITKPLADAINKDWVKQMGNEPWYKTLKAGHRGRCPAASCRRRVEAAMTAPSSTPSPVPASIAQRGVYQFYPVPIRTNAQGDACAAGMQRFEWTFDYVLPAEWAYFYTTVLGGLRGLDVPAELWDDAGNDVAFSSCKLPAPGVPQGLLRGRLPRRPDRRHAYAAAVVRSEGARKARHAGPRAANESRGRGPLTDLPRRTQRNAETNSPRRTQRGAEDLKSLSSLSSLFSPSSVSSASSAVNTRYHLCVLSRERPCMCGE